MYDAVAERDRKAIVDVQSGVSALKVESTAPATVFDIDGTLCRLGGDQKLFVEMTAILLEDAPQFLSTAQAAVVAGSSETVERSIHALKGLLLNCGGIRASEAAQALEDAAHSRDLSNADRLMRSLESELVALTRAIHDYPQSQ